VLQGVVEGVVYAERDSFLEKDLQVDPSIESGV
jgi:hypothetical protein